MRPATAKPQAAAQPPRIVVPEEVEGKLGRAVDTLLQAAGAGDAGPAVWAREAARRLQQMASPLLQRTERPRPAITSACRLMTLCLAAETAAADARVAMAFGDVAAGLTLLQQRRSGDAPVTETILLARA